MAGFQSADTGSNPVGPTIMRLFGQEVNEIGLECPMGGDHRRLVLDARTDCLHRALLPDDRYVLCSRCAKVVPLKI